MTENPATPEPTPDSDEQNDEIIGQAFQQSVKFIGIVAVVSLITWIGINFEPSSEPIEKGPEVPVRPRGVDGRESREPRASESPVELVRFKCDDLTERSDPI